MRALAQLAVVLLALGAGSACGSRNAKHFDGSNNPPPAPPGTATDGTLRITRMEVADQGSGFSEQTSPFPGTQVKRLTIGGAYLRRTDLTSPANKLSAGIHGNPTATQ